MQPSPTRPARSRPLLAAGASLLLLAACGVAQPSGGSPGQSDSGSASASATASSVPVAGTVAFTWPDGEEAAVTRDLTGIADQYINPGVVVEHGGAWHMFANVFSAWPGRVQVPHLVSDDGAAWTLDPATPVLTSDDVPLANPGADVSTGFVTDDGTWVLIFETVSITDPWVIGRATAPAPEGPWTIDPEPILEPGAAGSWDAGGLSWPSVVRTDAGYLMFFTGRDAAGTTGAIGLATSPDGVAWTKRDEPVLAAEADWEDGSLDRPRVAVTPDGLVMVYAGADLTDRGVAFSDDGTTWARDGDLPAITQDTFPVDGRAWDAALTYRDGMLTYYLEIGSSGSRGTNVYRATAELP